MTEVCEFLEEFEVYEARVLPRPVAPATDFVPILDMGGPGVYALVLDGKIIYVGKAKRLIVRIYSHYNAMWRRSKGEKPLRGGPQGIRFNSYMIMACHASDLDRVEKEMIAKYRPRYNRKNVPLGKSTLEQVGVDLTRLVNNIIKATPIYRRRLG